MDQFHTRRKVRNTFKTTAITCTTQLEQRQPAYVHLKRFLKVENDRCSGTCIKFHYNLSNNVPGWCITIYVASYECSYSGTCTNVHHRCVLSLAYIVELLHYTCRPLLLQLNLFDIFSILQDDVHVHTLYMHIHTQWILYQTVFL